MVAASLLGGCDSGGSSAECDGFAARPGTITANVGGERLEVSCTDVRVAAGRTFVIGYGAGGPAGVSTPITMTLDGTAAGTYVLDGNGSEDDSDESFVQLGLGGAATSFAISGAINVTDYSATRLRGTFAFETVSGVLVTDGRFEIDL